MDSRRHSTMQKTIFKWFKDSDLLGDIANSWHVQRCSGQNPCQPMPGTRSVIDISGMLSSATLARDAAEERLFFQCSWAGIGSTSMAQEAADFWLNFNQNMADPLSRFRNKHSMQMTKCVYNSNKTTFYLFVHLCGCVWSFCMLELLYYLFLFFLQARKCLILQISPQLSECDQAQSLRCTLLMVAPLPNADRLWYPTFGWTWQAWVARF